MSVTIPLTKGYSAVIDDEDYELVNQYKWQVDDYRKRWTCYAKTGTGGRQNHKHIKMHRLILNIAAGACVDHIDGDGLNNRRSNLRVASHQLNQANSRSLKGSSPYKGVSFHKMAKKWRACIQPNRKQIHLGLFENEKDAARAYDEKAFELFGVYARLNFPRVDFTFQICSSTGTEEEG